MSISSPGVGSGLDVNTIVSQLVAIEKQPLKPLQAKSSTFQSQLSAYGTIKSQVSALGDAASTLASTSNWSVQKATSSNAAVTASVSTGASASDFSNSVSQLSRAQTTASRSLASGATLGTAGQSGSLTFTLGSWASGTFAGSGTPVTVSGINGDDSLATIAAKINTANAGVSATVLKNGTQERLVFKASNTGEAAGFQITSDGGFAGLDSLSFTSLATPAESASGMQLGQTGLNANLSVNGVAIESASNTLTNVVPGLTLKLNQVTTAPVDVKIEADQEQVQKNIQAFVDSYNALAKTLTSTTRYVSGGASGVLQGDSTTIGIQRILRSMVSSVSSGSSFSRLTDVGLEQQTDGTLKVNQTRLTSAFADMSNLQKLFTTNNSDATTNGFGLKFKDFSQGLIASDGTVTNKATSIQGAIKRNTTEQDKVNDRAARIEKQLRQQYSALDVKMAQMGSLGSYVTAQLAQWNKTSS